MFTANVAGTAGSHLRSDVPHRDSNNYHSRHNLHDIDKETLGDEEKRLHRVQVDNGNNQIQNTEATNFRNHPFNWLKQNYKSCIYMSCLCSIILGGIVIIILAVMGIISTSNNR